MIRNTPIPQDIVESLISESGIREIGRAGIRELSKLVDTIEMTTGKNFIRMEMGVPGLEPAGVAVEAEIQALRRGVASKYANIEGIPELKMEISRFCKLFLNIDINPVSCLPTVGSMQGSIASFMVVNRNDRTKEGTLFIDPGFPVHKQQCKVLGHDYRFFDIYNYRGKKLKEKVESYLESGKVSSILYSNPNNPSWMCFTEEELQIIGELATKYDAIIIEDLAYVAMDFRKNVSVPGKPPYQSTVAQYTKNFIILMSCSKTFSYAGQRMAIMVISDELFHRKYPDLLRYYNSDMFGNAMIFGALYSLSAGGSHSAQFGIAAILKAVNDGKFNIQDEVREYAVRAKIMKQLFITNGFYIVYDKDVDVPVGDGFYFTIGYPGFSGQELLKELLFYGISAISLDITGSDRKDGLRACVSQVDKDQFGLLEERLKIFKEHHH